jgi:hypothetical protein
LEPKLDKVLEDNIAGDPMRSEVKWTHLNVREITQRIRKAGVRVSEAITKRLLKQKGFRRRKLYKNLIMKEVDGRDEQFRRIGRLKQYHLSRGHAVISIDSKKKEQIGRFYREGEVFCTQRVEVEDHDFASFAKGKITPFGVYDLGKNQGYVTISEGADTADLSVSCIKRWWQQHGSKTYQSKSILILCDGGGSNGSRNNLFKDGLDKLAKQYGLIIRVAHYPPYCSKYNPIEHRLFPNITNAWKGVILESVERAIAVLNERTRNLKSGLKISINRCFKLFEKGRTVSQEAIQNWCIKTDILHARWNYRFIPEKTY